MHGLSGSDADQNPQDLHTGSPLRHRRVKAGATLFDGREMECRRVGNRLDVGLRGEVGISSGNCCMGSCGQTRNGLRKLECGIEIGVSRVASVRKPELSAGPRRRTTLQRAKRLEIDSIRALRGQVAVEEPVVGDFIVGIVVDVLGHVHVKVSGAWWCKSDFRFPRGVPCLEFLRVRCPASKSPPRGFRPQPRS